MRQEVTDIPCPTCIQYMEEGLVRPEAVQRLPKGAAAPLSLDGRKWCHDCNAALNVTKAVKGINWEQARVAVANDRQEQYRLPGVLMGLVQANLMKPNSEGDFEDQLAWLERIGLLQEDPITEDES